MRQKRIMKRIIAVLMACMMTFLSIDAGCITTLATMIQSKPVEQALEFQKSLGAYDLNRDIPRLETSNADLGGLHIDKVTELPQTYDSRTKGYVTSVKNQNPWGTCWAFAACAAMESYALSHGLVDNPNNVDFSEYALAYLTFKDDLYYEQTGDKTVTNDPDVGFDAGGNDEYAFKTLSKWAGIYNEGTLRYYENGKSYSDGASNSKGELPAFDISTAESDFVFVGQKYINMQDTEQVKVSIMENGAVTASYFHGDAFENNGPNGESCLYYYNDSIKNTNHAITIVGWDDTVDAENFTTSSGKTPNRDGAWLIKNSWGPYLGKDGYMWISYEDVSINLTDAVVYEVAPKSLYDNIYQHDGATVFGLGVSSTKFASVYEIEDNTVNGEMIKAVSFAIMGATDAKYIVNIYKNTQNFTLNQGELVATTTGKTTYEGYYTAVLDKPVLTQQGEIYTVEICFDKSVYIAIGYDGHPIGGGGIATTECDSSDGESYILYYGSYVSTYEEGAPHHNLCIKMFTTDVIDYEVPQITNVEMTDCNKATISWQKIENAIGYRLRIQEMQENASPTETLLTFMNSGNANKITAELNVELGKEYKYQVCAIYDGGNASEYSLVQSFKAEIPAVELDVLVEENVAKLEWNKISFVDGYRIYRSSNWEGFEFVVDIPVVENDGKSKISYSDLELKYGYEYTYYVVSYVKVENGSVTPVYITSHLSNVEKVVIHVPTITNFSVKEYFYEKMVFNWNALGNVIDGYEIRIYKVTRDGNLEDYYVIYDTIDVNNGQTGSFVYTYDTQNLLPGTEIHVEICAYVNTDEGTVYSQENSSGYDHYVIPDQALDVDVEWYVKTQDGVKYLALLLEEQTQDSIYIRYYDALNSENPLRAYWIDLTNQQALTLYSSGDIPYSVRGYLYITDMNSSTAFQDLPYVIGGAYIDPELEKIQDITLTQAGQTVRLEADIKNPMENFNYRYQWYVAPNATDVGVAISGATEAVYETSVGSYEKKYFYCVVTVEYGTLSVFKTTNQNGNNTCIEGEGYTSNINVEYEREYVYSGQSIIPELVIKNGNIVLAEGVDYDVVYTNNINAGEATGTITFKGAYQNQASAIIRFTIVPKDSATLTLPSVSPMVFTGKELKPIVQLKDGTKDLTENVDYTVQYSNNINAGYAGITLKFKGNYKGTQDIVFEIKQKSAENVSYTYSSNISYTGKEITPAVVITDGDYTLVPNEDYKLSYENNKNAGNAKIKVVFSRNYYGEAERIFTISPRAAQDVTIDAISDKEYTGYAIVPNLSIQFGDVSLVKNTDYNVVYSNNTAVGTATVTINFVGNYSGQRTVSFQIVARSAENLSYEAIRNQVYTGKAMKPDLVIKNGDILLKNTVDYDVLYSNNLNVGTATAEITFKGNYKGTKKMTFVISPKSGINCVITKLPDVTYTGSAIEPDVEVKDGNTILRKDVDYTIAYHKNVNAGEALVSIVFKGNYTGSISTSFLIKPKSATNATVSDIQDQTYNGSEIIPQFKVTSGTYEYKKDVDYTVTISNNVNAGDAKLCITFIGNYSGSIEKTFRILPKNADEVEVSSIGDQKYTGSSIEPAVEVKDGNTVLVKGKDYDIVYKNNTNAGTASAIVSFKGNYKGGAKEVTFTIFEEIPSQITSSSVTISEKNGYISKISAGTSVSVLLSSLNEKRHVSIFDKNEKKLSDTDVVGTGMVAGIMNGSSIVKKYTIIVTGDTNGDGKINITDMIAVKACTLKKSDLSGAYEKAGDVNGDGKINITDFIKIKAAILKKDTISGVSVN